MKTNFSVIPAPDKGIRGQVPTGIQLIPFHPIFVIPVPARRSTGVSVRRRGNGNPGFPAPRSGQGQVSQE